MRKIQAEDKQNKNTTHICWTPLCIRHKTQINKTKNTIQYMLDTTIHKTQDTDKQSKKHNTICVGHHYTVTNKHK